MFQTECYSENPNVYKRERVPDPTGVGRPYMVQTSDPNSRWWCWVLGSERSQVAAEHVPDVVESLFLLLDAVEDVLVVGLGTGVFFG